MGSGRSVGGSHLLLPEHIGALLLHPEGTSLTFEMAISKSRKAKRKARPSPKAGENEAQIAVGERLKRLRESKGKTQVEQAADWDIASSSLISEWESGKGFPSVENLRKIVDSERRALGGRSTISVHWLLFGEGATDPLAPDANSDLATAIGTYLRAHTLAPDWQYLEDLSVAELGRRVLDLAVSTADAEVMTVYKTGAGYSESLASLLLQDSFSGDAIAATLREFGSIETEASLSSLRRRLDEAVAEQRRFWRVELAAYGIAEARQAKGLKLLRLLPGDEAQAVIGDALRDFPTEHIPRLPLDVQERVLRAREG